MSISRNQTIYGAFKNCAINHPNDTALIYQGKKFKYQHVLNNVNRLAQGLLKAGYKADDVITIALPNIPSAVYLLYAVNQIGAIANLIHPLMKNAQLKDIMIKTKSRILFTLDTNANNFANFKDLGVYIAKVSPVFELNPIAHFIYNYNHKIKKDENDISKLIDNPPLERQDNSYLKDSFYLHSGGTTSTPKTIALSSYAINSLAISGLKFIDENDAHNMGMLSVLPMFHGFGLVMGIHISLIHDAYNVLMPKFNSNQVIKYLRHNQIQNIIGVPVLYEALLRNKKFAGKKLRGIKNAFVGGDFLNDSMVKRFDALMIKANAKARLFEGYGMTETVAVVSVNTHKEHRDNSVGKVIPFANVKIFNPITKKELGPDEAGEIYVSGDTLMNGYRFEKTPLNPYYIDENNVRYIRTGDYGHLDKDGYLYFTQRLKRIIKVNGINVFPSAIENAIMHLPYVFECYVQGIRSNKFGNIIRLFVVLDRKYLGQNFNNEINRIIVDKFGVYAFPKEIIYLNKLPKTLVGKVDEKELNKFD